MKTFFLILSLLVCAASAQAQYVKTTLYAGGTNGVTNGGSVYPTNKIVSVLTSSQISVAGKFSLMGSGTTPITFTFIQGTATNTFDLLATNYLTFTPNGTAVVTARTNFTVGGNGYLKLYAISNANSSAVTNLLIITGSKGGS